MTECKHCGTDAAQVRADARREVAEEITAAIEALPDVTPEGVAYYGWQMRERAAHVAHRIAREAARADTEEADCG